MKLGGSAVHGKGGVRHLPNHSPNVWIPGSLGRRKGEGIRKRERQRPSTDLGACGLQVGMDVALRVC